MRRVLSFDFGASGGRAILSTCHQGKISMQEVHRFANEPVMLQGTLYWDILRLFHELKTGISKALKVGAFEAIGIDTWGVDFGLLDADGRLLENPVHYRDRRTEPMEEQVCRTISREELYAETGIQNMRINTVYQLAALQHNRPELWKNAAHLLLIPDLFAYFLTGKMRTEITNASTTNLFDPRKKEWSSAILQRLSIPSSLFAPRIVPGEPYGLLSDALCRELNCPAVPVLAVASHDTASAVAAVPAEKDRCIYLSSGTWSLFGTILDQPITDPADMTFTNEGALDGKIRYLKNIMGLWLLQESRRQWRREGLEVNYDLLERETRQAKPFVSFIDVDAPLFETAGNMPQRVCAFCADTGQHVPETRGEVLRCIYESLAMRYRQVYDKLTAVVGERLPIHVIGGGIKDRLLCQMTANSCGVPVIAGPAEATAFGNSAALFYGLGVLETPSDIHRISIASNPTERYEPEEQAVWEQAREAYVRLLDR